MWCTWIVEAWREISDEVDRKSFKTGILNALDASEDDLLWSRMTAIRAEKMSPLSAMMNVCSPTRTANRGGVGAPMACVNKLTCVCAVDVSRLFIKKYVGRF